MSGRDMVVSVRGVSKKYCRSLKQGIRYGLMDLARNTVGLEARARDLRPGEFWAVNDVSVEVQRGEVLGIVGKNGSGKSTLLKLLNGIFMPDGGEIEVHGRVGALIEVGAGFHPMLTGRENIYVNGAILGLSRRELDDRLESIIEFSGVRDFIDTPVKFYSSGMYVRLGFAVAAHMQPDVLLIDEVLAVGDAAFHAKCYAALSRLRQSGTAIIVVSHNMVELQRICTRCVWMKDGRVAAEGSPARTISEYLVWSDSLSAQSYLADAEAAGAEAPSTRVAGAAGRGRGSVELVFPEFLIGAGAYSTNVGLWDEEFFGAYDWRWNCNPFRVISDRPMPGRFMLAHHWSTTEPHQMDFAGSPLSLRG
jgi:ABC-type polysaccharide/polyol phosphate transport system ATPase subunit